MLTRRSLIATALAVPAAAALTRPALAAKPPVFASGGIAINGYDPVAYFTMGKPVKGDEAISSEWEGAKLIFASADIVHDAT